MRPRFTRTHPYWCGGQGPHPGLTDLSSSNRIEGSLSSFSLSAGPEHPRRPPGRGKAYSSPYSHTWDWSISLKHWWSILWRRRLPGETRQVLTSVVVFSVCSLYHSLVQDPIGNSVTWFRLDSRQTDDLRSQYTYLCKRSNRLTNKISKRYCVQDWLSRNSPFTSKSPETRVVFGLCCLSLRSGSGLRYTQDWYPCTTSKHGDDGNGITLWKSSPPFLRLFSVRVSYQPRPDDRTSRRKS